MAFTQQHHAVIQAFMSHGPQKEQDARALVEAVVTGNEAMEVAISRINTAIGVLQLEIRAGVDQRDGSVWYGLVNRAADKQAKLGTTYSHAQLQLFRAIVDKIALQGDVTGVMRSMQVHHLVMPPAEQPEEAVPSNSQRVAAPKALTGSEKVQTVERLVEERWLEYCGVDGEPEGEEARGSRSGSGRRGRGRQSQSQSQQQSQSQAQAQAQSAAGIKLGIRTFLELRQYLASIEGVARCDFCGDAVVEGRPCPSEECDFAVHFHCERAKFQGARDPKCPKCDTRWPHVIPSEQEPEDASQAERASQPLSQRTNSSQGAGRAKRPKREPRAR